VGLELGPLSLVRISEKLLEWKSSGSGSRKSKLTALGIRCANHGAPSSRKKLALTSPTSSGRSVGIVRLQTKATVFSFRTKIYKNTQWLKVWSMAGFCYAVNEYSGPIAAAKFLLRYLYICSLWPG
jgi:hypothetical protein